MMPWSLLLNRYTFAGLGILAVLGAVFWAGDRYGFNARSYAQCKSETQRRNDAVALGNAIEEKRHVAEEARRLSARNAFNSQSSSIGQCLLTGDQAAALNGIGE